MFRDCIKNYCSPDLACTGFAMKRRVLSRELANVGKLGIILHKNLLQN